MKLTIIKSDGMVAIDGQPYFDLDLSAIPDNVHAVQWSGEVGEVEHKDPATGKMTANEEITSLDQFQVAIDAWTTADAAAKAEAAARAATQPQQGNEAPQ